jgi:hypothetical protein
MPRRLASLIAGLVVVLAHPAPAQEAFSIPAKPLLHFESWRPAPIDSTIAVAGKFLVETEDRKDKWLIGGAVGAAAGIVFCTAMSTLINDSAAGGLSFCPLDSYLMIGGAGFLLGAAVGLAF